MLMVFTIGLLMANGCLMTMEIKSKQMPPMEKMARIADDDFTIDSRMMLDVTVQRDRDIIYHDICLNDVAITKGSVGRIVHLNVKCDGVTDHFNGVAYRLYTMVVTYKNLEGEALEAAMAQKLVARSYMGYYDANGLYRYYYNNYTGENVYNGCSSSYADTLAMDN